MRRPICPFRRIAKPEDLFDDPQLNEGGSLLETVLPNGRKTKLPRQPVLLEEHEWSVAEPSARGRGSTMMRFW